jgi:glypican 5
VLHTANNNTKSMLLTTYKIPTQDVHEFTDDLFADLASYLRHHEIDIDESAEDFFDSLFPAVYLYTLNDPTVTGLTPAYRDCLMAVRKDLQTPPFGAGARRLATDLVKAFGIARALLDAFDLAVDVINATDHAHFEHQCSRALTRLMHCSRCDGHPEVRPCALFCQNVMRGCLVSVAELNPHWNLFVDAVERVATSMRGTHDIQSVMHAFHSRVSESIMHAMETVHKYRPQV